MEQMGGCGAGSLMDSEDHLKPSVSGGRTLVWAATVKGVLIGSFWVENQLINGRSFSGWYFHPAVSIKKSAGFVKAVVFMDIRFTGASLLMWGEEALNMN